MRTYKSDPDLVYQKIDDSKFSKQVQNIEIKTEMPNGYINGYQKNDKKMKNPVVKYNFCENSI